MNLLQMAQRLHSELLRSTQMPMSIVGASELNARSFNRLAYAWTELQNERRWLWMRSTTDVALTIGQQTYSDTDLDLTRFGRWRTEDERYQPYLYIDGSPNTLWPLCFEHLDRFRQLWVYLDMGNTQPISWSVDEQQRFLVGPAPAAAYKLRAEFWLSPTELTADADEPDMPERFHMVLVWRALIDMAKADAKPEILAMAEDNYAKAHAQLRRDQDLRLKV